MPRNEVHFFAFIAIFLKQEELGCHPICGGTGGWYKREHQNTEIFSRQKFLPRHRVWGPQVTTAISTFSICYSCRKDPWMTAHPSHMSCIQTPGGLGIQPAHRWEMTMRCSLWNCPVAQPRLCYHSPNLPTLILSFSLHAILPVGL